MQIANEYGYSAGNHDLHDAVIKRQVLLILRATLQHNM